jgi:gas vesicle protein
MSRRRPDLDDSATFVGILLGIVIGALFALFRVNQRGSVRRKDLAQFGAGSAEVEMAASLQEAKRSAKSRIAEQS